MKFYRYVSVQYASIDDNGEYYISKIPNPKLELRVYNLFKETPKGYWIGYGNPGGPDNGLNSPERWVSKTARKRFAYPTEKEALVNYIKRTQKRIKILSYQVTLCRLSLSDAVKYLEEFA